MKAVFIDRDGTVAKDVGYCRRVDDFEILPLVSQAIKILNQHGFKVVVITNQSGVGRGYFTEATLQQIHQYMEQELVTRGARIDAIYYCPHHPDENCQCRKPRPGLLLRAAADLGISLGDSFMVGDSDKDVNAGKAAGCQSILIANEHYSKEETTSLPDYIASSLYDAANWVISQAP